ncbi:hypothetical protein JCM19992_06680 [Thermostilla marina]
MFLLAESSLFGLFVLAFVVMVVYLSVRNAAKKNKRRASWGSRGDTIKAMLDGVAGKPLGPFATNEDQAHVRLEERFREIEGTLDTKIALLENLIREADRAAARLEKALNMALPEELRELQSQSSDKPEQDDDAGLVSASLVPEEDTTPSPPPERFEETPTGEENVDSVPSTRRGTEPATGDAAESSSTTTIAEPATSASDELPAAVIDEVITLADYGFETSEIAARLELPTSAVRRVLAKRRGSSRL